MCLFFFRVLLWVLLLGSLVFLLDYLLLIRFLNPCLLFIFPFFLNQSIFLRFLMFRTLLRRIFHGMSIWIIQRRLWSFFLFLKLKEKKIKKKHDICCFLDILWIWILFYFRLGFCEFLYFPFYHMGIDNIPQHDRITYCV